MQTINTVHTFITNTNNTRIILLRNREVIQWLFEDTSFLPHIVRKNKTTDMQKYKVLEDKWGQDTLRTYRRNDLKLDKQWTNKFGEYICEEILILHGKEVTKPPNKSNFQPDLEVDNAIWEAKIGTYYTSGTAHEKILGCPYKYADVPLLYGKPLKILCMAGAEKVCREQYGLFGGERCTAQKKKYIDFYNINQIDFVSATDMLRKLVE